MNNKVLRRVFGALLATLVSVSVASSAAPTFAIWKTGVGAWSVPSNWECGLNFPTGCVPTTVTQTTIDNGGTANLDLNASVQSLLIQSGRLKVLGAVTLVSQGSVSVGGYGGDGTLTINDGGQVTSGYGTIGGNGGTGTASVSGAGSKWDAGNGMFADGTLTIEDGGMVTSGGTFLGGIGMPSPGFGPGNATVSGTGSQWNQTTFLEVGAGTSGTLSIIDGAVVNSAQSFIGAFGGTGTVTVTGSGSQWNG
jgi:T5SS/PEP-CTERM-associated repeat protein